MTLRSIQFSILLAGILGTAQAAPYGKEGHQTRWTQPNGKVVAFKVFGDEYYGRTETGEGYTVVRDAENNTYYYAKLSQDGKSLVPTQVPADQQAPAGLAKHLEIPMRQIFEARSINRKKYDGDRAKRWDERVKALSGGGKGAPAPSANAKGAPNDDRAAPFIGNKRGLTILAQFPNDPATGGADPINFPATRSKMIDYCNGVGYSQDGNSGSIRDYFFDQSLGKLTYTQTVTEIVTLPQPREYYNYADYPRNRTFRDDAGRVLLLDAIKVLKAQNFDFSSVSLDAQNRAYATNIFFAGPDSGSWSNGLWPHQWTLAQPENVGTAASPIFINAYQITNIANSAPVIGTFCHENGHLILGYPDLYDYGNESEGVGEHCSMGSGSYNNGGRTPAPINAYFKEVAGWGNITDIAVTDFQTYRLPTTGNRAYRLRKPGTATEYFVVENRGEGDKWAEYCVDKGIVIWHIDETVSGNNDEQMTPEAHYQVSVEQADGAFDLENGRNRGDARDFFDVGTSRFNDTTTPNARWWDDTRSGVMVEVIGGSAKNTEVHFCEVPANTIILGSPNGGEVIFPGSQFEVTWKANITGNVKIELIKAGKVFAMIAASEVNDGAFTWTVPTDIPKTKDYTIRISSLTNTVAATDESVARFGLSSQSFPARGVLPYGWFKPGYAFTDWTVTDSEFYEGNRSLVSKPLQDGETAAIAYRSNFKAGTMSFYMKVSTEARYDYGRFFIDGVEQKLSPLSATKGLTGEVDWTFFAFPVTAGTHTFQWTHEKDDSYGGFKDRVWIDGVTFPSTTEEIAVEDQKGENLIAGKSLTLFSGVRVSEKSKGRNFTIKNRGKAALSGIQVKIVGMHKGDFEIVGELPEALVAGESASFKVVFAPTRAGSRKAEVRILSNDADEGSFEIDLRGKALGLPKIVVSQINGLVLKDDGRVQKFGKTRNQTVGMTRMFSVTNNGKGVLKGLKILKSGLGRADFSVSNFGKTVLSPGESTSFKVMFRPRSPGNRAAVLRIRSNDPISGIFEVNVIGRSLKGKVKGSSQLDGAGLGNLANAVLGDQVSSLSSPKSSTAVEVANGEKFLSLTLSKDSNGSRVQTVEVSSNLVDWYSGENHTTVMIDDATTLKVRDNTPITPDQKRFIRVK